MHILVKVVKLLIMITLYLTPSLLEANFQQKADYKIDISLNHEEKTLEGVIIINYQNNSKDTLNEFFFHVWPNAYADKYSTFGKQQLENGNAEFLKAAPQDLGYLSGLSFTQNGNEVRYTPYNNWNDVVKVLLHEPILPQQKTIFETPFKVKFPAVFSRMGVDGNYFIASQWYPKPAKYDQDGWHPMPYLDQGEYYSDFASFDVSITLSEDFFVASTGILQNEEEILKLQSQISKTREMLADSSINVVKATKISSQKKTLNFKQDNITDFAWFASPDFLILKDSIILSSKQQVDVFSYFLTPSPGWQKSAQVLKQSVSFFSEIIGDYPYTHCSLVEGPLRAGGGMEYPMVTIVDNFSNPSILETVIAHEVAHNWWQGILAPNERNSPWIDEGFTSHYEKRYIEKYGVPYLGNLESMGMYHKLSKHFGFEGFKTRDDESTAVLFQQRNNLHQPISTSSEDFSSFNYYAMVYAQSSLLIEYLENYLGRIVFDDIIRDFYKSYQFKHIDASDIQMFFEEKTGKSLSWFFEDLVTTMEKTDFSIKKITKSPKGYALKVKNKSGFLQPFPIQVYEKDSLIKTQWFEGSENRITEVELAHPNASRFILDENNLLLDYNRSNNIIKTSGFKKIEPLAFTFLGGMERFNKSKIAFSPIVSGNKYDKWMVGAMLSNSFFPAKQWQWTAMPFYAIGTKQFNWMGKVSYSQHIKNSKLKTITYELYSKSFSFDNANGDNLRFYKWFPKFTFDIRKDYRSTLLHEVSIRHNQVYTQGSIVDTTDTVTLKSINRNCVNVLQYKLTKNDARYQNVLTTNFHFNKDFGKLFFENNFFLPYAKRNNGKGLNIRSFLGTFLYRSNDIKIFRGTPVNFNTINITGRNDYLFDGIFLDRQANEGFMSQMVMAGDGGLKGINYTNPNIGKAGSFLFGLNIRADAPFRAFPVSAFFDLVYHNESQALSTSNGINFAMGTMVRLLNGGLEVYIPFVTSEDFKNNYKAFRPKLGQRITFSIDLQKLDFRKKAKNYYLGF